MVYPSLELSAFSILPNILTSPQCSSHSIGWKLNNGFNIRSSPLLQLPSYNRTRVPPQAHKYQNSQQNPFLRSSVSFPSTCFHQAQVCRSIIPQLLTPLMELSTNKSKILRSRHTPLHHSHQLYSFHPCRALSLSRNQFLSCLTNPPLYSFPPSINSLLSRFSMLLSRPASFNQYSSRTNASKHQRIHHHLRVLISRGLYKALVYLT